MTERITRRNFLGGLAVVGAAPLVVCEQAVPRHPQPNPGQPTPGQPNPGPPNPNPGPNPASGKAVLTQNDFKYAGVFTLPFDAQIGFSNGALAGRRVGGDLHLFVCGGKPSGDPVVEVVYGGPGRDPLQAPRAALARNWGDIYRNQRLIASGGGITTRGLLWANDQLYWSYGDEYAVTGVSDPSIGTTVLNTDGSTRTYGPWRTDEHSQKTRGYMLQIPEWFRQYTSGRAWGVGAPITSGNANSPWGALVNAIKFPDNTAPADRTSDAHTSISSQRLVYHDIDHKQKRDTNYKFCGWNVQYDCSKGSWVKPGSPEFNGIDMMSAAAWVDLPDKHGVVFFGQLSTAIPGYAYGGGDTVPHYWYGPGKCCHGQDGEPASEGTGDATGSSVPYVWVFDPSDLVRAAQQSVDPWGFEPKAAFGAFSLTSNIPNRAGALYLFGGAYFDADSRSLFVTQIYADSLGPEPQPIVHVFTIA